MSKIIFGLSWKHPAVVTSGIALLLDIIYVLTKFFLHIPSGNHPYYRTILGAIAGIELALWGFSSAHTKFEYFFGYFIISINLFLSFCALFETIKYLVSYT